MRKLKRESKLTPVPYPERAVARECGKPARGCKGLAPRLRPREVPAERLCRERVHPQGCRDLDRLADHFRIVGRTPGEASDGIRERSPTTRRMRSGPAAQARGPTRTRVPVDVGGGNLRDSPAR